VADKANNLYGKNIFLPDLGFSSWKFELGYFNPYPRFCSSFTIYTSNNTDFSAKILTNHINAEGNLFPPFPDISMILFSNPLCIIV
jgi:hypothetical protein